MVKATRTIYYPEKNAAEVKGAQFMAKSKPDVIISKGLDDIIVEESTISYVDGEKGRLIYRGFDIETLAKHSNFEEVAYVVWNGDLPTKSQYEELKKQLAANRSIPGEVLSILKLLPKSTHPMDAMKAAVSALAPFDSELQDNSREANLRKSIRLTAKFPTIVSAFNRIRNGQEPIQPNHKLDHATNFLYMLSGLEPTVLAGKVMDTALVLHIEHEMNASAFACVVTASTLSDIYSAVVSGIGTLKGPLHGGANEAALKMMNEIGSPDKAEAYVLKALRERRKVPGFGHRVYKAYDPRARIFKQYVKDLSEAKESTLQYDVASKVEQVAIRELGAAKGIFPNIDFYSGIVYNLFGIPTDLFTSIFAVARVVGWAAHVMEYLEDNRLIRPRAHYVGPLERAYISIDQRQERKLAVTTLP